MIEVSERVTPVGKDVFGDGNDEAITNASGRISRGACERLVHVGEQVT